jgi:hypothetical protein
MIWGCKSWHFFRVDEDCAFAIESEAPSACDCPGSLPGNLEQSEAGDAMICPDCGTYIYVLSRQAAVAAYVMVSYGLRQGTIKITQE